VNLRNLANELSAINFCHPLHGLPALRQFSAKMAVKLAVGTTFCMELLACLLLSLITASNCSNLPTKGSAGKAAEEEAHAPLAVVERFNTAFEHDMFVATEKAVTYSLEQLKSDDAMAGIRASGRGNQLHRSEFVINDLSFILGTRWRDLMSILHQLVHTARECIAKLDVSAGGSFFRTSEESRNVPPCDKVKSRTGGSRNAEAELRRVPSRKKGPAFKDQAPFAQSHISDCQRKQVLTSSNLEKSVVQEPGLIARRLQAEAFQQGVLPPVKIFMYDLELEYNWDIASQSLKDFRSKRDSPESQDDEGSTSRSHGTQHRTSFFLVSDLLASGERCRNRRLRFPPHSLMLYYLLQHLSSTEVNTSWSFT
jgi:hypothetical protein